MKKISHFKITEKDAEQRLDIFLVEKLGISRSQAQRIIEEGLVLLNEKVPKKPGNTLKVGNTVSVSQKSKVSAQDGSASGGESRKSETVEPAANPMTANIPLPPSRGELATPKVIAVTKDYIVVEKPTGMLTHPTMAKETNALSSWLLKKYPQIKKVGDPAPRGVQGKLVANVRPGIVHRLDKEASGLLVVARTQKMFEHLKEQFKNRTVEKEYLALVHGKVAKDWDEIKFPISRSETLDRMAARPILNRNVMEGEKEAHTEFLVEKRFVNFGLLRVILHTGRMHQIRVHMLAYNHPLVGDPLYNQKKRKHNWDEKLGRLFLHSTKLSFVDLDGVKQTFESPLPEELASFLKTLA